MKTTRNRKGFFKNSKKSLITLIIITFGLLILSLQHICFKDSNIICYSNDNSAIISVYNGNPKHFDRIKIIIECKPSIKITTYIDDISAYQEKKLNIENMLPSSHELLEIQKIYVLRYSIIHMIISAILFLMLSIFSVKFYFIFKK